MDSKGNQYESDNYVRCKTTHNLTYSNMCIVMHEVGGNTCQNADGNIEGKLLVCETGM